MRLVRIYEECLALDNRLEIKIGELGLIASEIYGAELRADMCTGSEIEFRRLCDNGFVDVNSIILIEDIIAKNKIT